ncbi:Fc.00g095550.m01.CDS01 [Cosmosporella sp. VM-42]
MGFFKASGVPEECEKAAQILKAFLDKRKIPTEAIANAKGLAIFTGFRAGMYIAGTGGSGVVIARLADGTWSPPSAFSVRSGGIGLVYGMDVYDCVCVLNTQEAVDAYTKSEMSLGGAATIAVGPMGGNVNMKDAKPVWTYTKSRGLYGGVTMDGTVIKERPDANARFYGSKVTAAQILKGKVEAERGDSQSAIGVKKFYEVLKVAEGKEADPKVLQQISTEPTPGDLEEQ